jgi:hypothetical protein
MEERKFAPSWGQVGIKLDAKKAPSAQAAQGVEDSQVGLEQNAVIREENNSMRLPSPVLLSDEALPSGSTSINELLPAAPRWEAPLDELYRAQAALRSR